MERTSSVSRMPYAPPHPAPAAPSAKSSTYSACFDVEGANALMATGLAAHDIVSAENLLAHADVLVVGESTLGDAGDRFILENLDLLASQPETYAVATERLYADFDPSSDADHLAGPLGFAIARGVTVIGLDQRFPSRILAEWGRADRLLQQTPHDAESKDDCVAHYRNVLELLKTMPRSAFGEAGVQEIDAAQALLGNIGPDLNAQDRAALKQGLDSLHSAVTRLAKWQAGFPANLNPDVAYAVAQQCRRYEKLIVLVPKHRAVDFDHADSVLSLLRRNTDKPIDGVFLKDGGNFQRESYLAAESTTRSQDECLSIPVNGGPHWQDATAYVPSPDVRPKKHKCVVQ